MKWSHEVVTKMASATGEQSRNRGWTLDRWRLSTRSDPRMCKALDLEESQTRYELCQSVCFQFQYQYALAIVFFGCESAFRDRLKSSLPFEFVGNFDWKGALALCWVQCQACRPLPACSYSMSCVHGPYAKHKTREVWGNHWTSRWITESHIRHRAVSVAFDVLLCLTVTLEKKIVGA